MALTKDDIQAIGEAVRPVMREEIGAAIDTQVRPLVREEIGVALEKQVRPMIQASEKRLVAEMEKRFAKQNESMGRHFADLQALMEQTYVKREEFEQLREDFQNELDDLRKEVQRLQQRVSTA